MMNKSTITNSSISGIMVNKSTMSGLVDYYHTMFGLLLLFVSVQKFINYLASHPLTNNVYMQINATSFFSVQRSQS